jgi:hypothetical protein
MGLISLEFMGFIWSTGTAIQSHPSSLWPVPAFNLITNAGLALKKLMLGGLSWLLGPLGLATLYSHIPFPLPKIGWAREFNGKPTPRFYNFSKLKTVINTF